MITLTRKTEYALISLTFLARRQAAGDGAVNSRGIADQFKLPGAMVSNVLKELAGVGMVKSTRGKAGGYELGVDASEVSILDVVGVIEGGVRLVPCCEGLNDGGDTAGNNSECCEIEKECVVKGPLQRLQVKMNEFLRDVSLADLLSASEHDQPCGCGCSGVVNLTFGQTCMGLASEGQA